LAAFHAIAELRRAAPVGEAAKERRRIVKRIFLAAAASTLTLAACRSNYGANNAEYNAGANETYGNEAGMGNAAAPGVATANVDAAFLTDAMKGDNSEVALGKIAQSKGASQGVKDLGTMLVTDHGAHKTEVAALAQQAGVAITDDIKDEAKSETAKLDGLSGAAFDTEFARATVEDHKPHITATEQQAKSGDAQTAALANKTLPTLRKHLRAAQALQK
jgi:putative membrane protein